MNAFEGARRKGYKAGLEGKPITAYPYEDWRTGYREGVTWSRGFILAWIEGWRKGSEERQKNLKLNVKAQRSVQK